MKRICLAVLVMLAATFCADARPKPWDAIQFCKRLMDVPDLPTSHTQAKVERGGWVMFHYETPVLHGASTRHSVGCRVRNHGAYQFEPPRVFRRPFRLSHAAMAGSSNLA
jgi:hypothetical protein